MVVHAVLNEALSMREAAARFNISNETVVRRWASVYNHAVPEVLQNMKRGRPREMTRKTTPLSTDTDMEQLFSEELWTELRYLRVENAYLKKLKALVQSEKTAKSPNHQRTQARVCP
ncbi:hypothetical protein PEC301879_34260 [Pectobacterium carotovorum subsp. carotovorum]|nr:hypothetical protein PEC301879_34260 [Pectobacterium carotovorum subsp. carotovorum]